MHRLVVATIGRVMKTWWILWVAAIYGAVNWTEQSLKDHVYAHKYNNIHRVTYVIYWLTVTACTFYILHIRRRTDWVFQYKWMTIIALLYRWAELYILHQALGPHPLFFDHLYPKKVISEILASSIGENCDTYKQNTVDYSRSMQSYCIK